MVRLGQREFPVPIWLWAALPLAALAYAWAGFVFPRISRFYVGAADRSFLAMMVQLGIAWLAAFLFIDIVRRARTPWYGVPIIYIASAAAALILISDGIVRPFTNVAMFVAGVLISFAASTRAGGGELLMMLVFTVVLPFVMGLAAALVVTLASRIVARQPVRSRDTWREFVANLFGATVWMMIAIGGYLALRHNVTGRSANSSLEWLPYAASALGAAAAAAVHLLLVWRSRRGAAAETADLRLWLLAVAAVGLFVWRPDALGISGVRAYYDYTRPALRALGVLPTPALVVAGYRIDVPYHDLTVSRVAPQPDGSAMRINAFFPDEFGLKRTDGGRARIIVSRRDVPMTDAARVMDGWHKALNEAQAGKPGQEVMVRRPAMAPAVLMRDEAHPELEFVLSNFHASVPWEIVEDALRRFAKERVRRAN